MCLICRDVILEKFTPQEFWNNYREQLLTEENDHWKEVIETVKKTSLEYQNELMKYWD